MHKIKYQFCNYLIINHLFKINNSSFFKANPINFFNDWSWTMWKHSCKSQVVFSTVAPGCQLIMSQSWWAVSGHYFNSYKKCIIDYLELMQFIWNNFQLLITLSVSCIPSVKKQQQKKLTLWLIFQPCLLFSLVSTSMAHWQYHQPIYCKQLDVCITCQCFLSS